MSKTKKQLWSLLSVVVISAVIWSQTHSQETYLTQRMLASYLTSSNRSSTLNIACASYTRDSLYKSEGIQMSSLVSTVNSSVGIDGTEVIRLAADVSFDSAKTKATNNFSGYLVFLLSFGVGLAILLLLFPFFMCFCLCPYCCPLQCCDRASDYNPLEERNVRIHLIILTVLLLLVIAACVYGLIVTGENRSSYKKAACTAAIATDDVMNGNSTNNGDSYFIGMNRIPEVISSLQTNLTNIDNNLTQVHSTTSTTTFNQAITYAQTAETDTIKISNNDVSGSNLTLNYNTPIDSFTTSSTISSTFPAVLGSYSSQKGLVWSLYSSIYSFEQFLSKFKANVTDLHNNLSLYSQVLAWAATNASTLKTQVSKGISDTNQPIEKWSDGADKYEKSVFGYFFGMMGLCLVCLLFACVAFRCESDCFRKLMYVMCPILFLACLLSFFIAVIYSAVLPPYAWTCNYFNQTISSQYYFQKNLNFMFDISTLQKVGTCMPYDNGYIYEQLATTAGAVQLETLKGIFTNLNTFQLEPYTTSIYSSLNSALTTQNSYALGELIDITDSSAISVLRILANYSLGSYTNCNSNAPADSWVPSNSQSSQSTTVIPCTATNGKSGTATTCSSGVSSTASSCSGCMDSSQVLFRYLNVANNLPTDLASRYGSTCTLNIKLNNVWTNYYKVKLTAIGPTVGGTSSSSGVYPRTKTVETDVNNLNSTVTPALPNLFTTINTNMASISSLTNPTYGIFGGLNCSVIGEDAQRVRGTTCGTAFTHTFIIRMVTGIIAYLLLASLCFMVSFGNKHSRFFEGKKYLQKPNPQGYPESASPIAYPGVNPGANPYQYNMNPKTGQLENPYAYDSNAIISSYQNV